MFRVNTLLNQKTEPNAKWKQQDNKHLKCCRTCLSTKDLKYLFSESESMKSTVKYFKLITGLEVEKSDGLSQKICTRCIEILEMAVEFRYRSHKTYNLLLKLKEIKTKRNTNHEREPCWIEVKSLETCQNMNNFDDFDNYIDDDQENYDIIYYNDAGDNNDTFDNSVKNYKIVNSNSSENKNVFRLNKNDGIRNLDQDKRLKKRDGATIPLADIYKCEECGKEYTKQISFRAHVRNHTYFLICEFCGKTFRCESTLNSHKSAVHGFEKKYKCNLCDYTSAYKDPLRQHQKRHAGEKPFQCDYCGESFHKKRTLKQHITRHTVFEATIPCPLCPKTFRTANALHGHKYNVHRQKIYRYGCPLCERTYRESAVAFRHGRKVHKVQFTSLRKIPIDGTNN